MMMGAHANCVESPKPRASTTKNIDREIVLESIWYSQCGHWGEITPSQCTLPHAPGPGGMWGNAPNLSNSFARLRALNSRFSAASEPRLAVGVLDNFLTPK